ncbi:hypothetical protein BRADI_3g15775v3 [Brachypodium distachyon]|uniref:Uncharacterized protein n=1 Tax=Brachypodium distachyon TaxID=15368 RepID=A0A2K2CXE1_BRADI|nr:hypothetical protein BRADI_3g15775v3 [Brachypodium distachyon]
MHLICNDSHTHLLQQIQRFKAQEPELAKPFSEPKPYLLQGIHGEGGARAAGAGEELGARGRSSGRGDLPVVDLVVDALGHSKGLPRRQ